MSLLLVLLATATAGAESASSEIPLAPGSESVLPIAADATLRWALVGDTGPGDASWVVTIEERGVDLVAEVLGSGEPVTSPIDHGGTIFLVLDSSEQRITARVEEGEGDGEVAIRARRAAVGSQPLAAAEAMRDAGRGAFEASGTSRRTALDAYARALLLWRRLGEKRYEAEAFESRALLLRRLGEMPQALIELEAALALWREIDEVPRIASVLSDVGLTQRDLGHRAEARDSLDQALSIYRRRGDRREESIVSNVLCMLDHAAGNLRQAVDCYREALDLSRAAANVGTEASVLNNLGFAWDGLGEPAAARQAYGEALEIRRRLDDPAGAALLLNNLAGIDRRTGQFTRALERYLAALESFTELGDRRRIASVRNNLGTVYASLGEPERSRAFYEETLALRRQTGDRRGEVISLNNLGTALRQLGEIEAALEHHRQALELARELGSEVHVARSLEQLGRAALEAGRPALAVPDFSRAITVAQKLGDRSGEALATAGRGEALLDLGELEAAGGDLDRARTLFRRVQNPAAELDVLVALARWERARGDPEAAMARAVKADALLESLRVRLARPQLGAALAARQTVSELLVDLLMERHARTPDAGFDERAFAVGERARARALREVLERREQDPGLGPSTPFTDRRAELTERFAAKLDRRLRLDEGDPRAAALEAEIRTLESQLDDLEKDLPRPRVRELPELPVLQSLLDPGTVLLSYFLGQARSFAWRVTRDAFASFELPSRPEIEALARQVHEDLRTVGSGREAEEQRNLALSRAILSPVLLGPETERLAISADGALHYLPFAALLDPSAPGAPRPLIERFEIVHVPSIAVLAFQRRRSASGATAEPPGGEGPAVAILADPAFGDAAELDDLPATRREAEQIAALATDRRVHVALGAEANRDLVLGPEVGRARIVHLATHGFFDTRRPELSGLVFSLVDASGRPREGFVSLRDLDHHQLTAELVTLSACSTALGRELRGEGLIGVTRGFLDAGATRVLASLWQVRDRATAELMVHFYRALWRENLPPAQALRLAQLELRRQPRWRDPYFWSAFVLHGDWR